MSHNFLLRLFIRAPDERFWDPGFKFVHSVYTIFALFFVSTDLLQLAYTCQFFSLCPTLDTSGVFRQYPHCLPVCVVFVHLSVDILLIVGQFYNIEKRNRQLQPPFKAMRSALPTLKPIPFDKYSLPIRKSQKSLLGFSVVAFFLLLILSGSK